MTPRLGVLLVNLGGPERLEDVKPFLVRLFSDPGILPIHRTWLRKTVAWLIATARQKTSRGYYEKLGGGSPLRRITEQQARALQTALEVEGIASEVFVGMQCWNPSLEEALERIRRCEVTHLVVLPLYPQFSRTTTGSLVEALRRRFEDPGWARAIHHVCIDHWFDEPAYIEALAETIREEIGRFPDPDPGAVHLLYSAHAIPLRLVEQGDPYLEQTRRTVELVNARLGGRSPWTLAFQSKLGPVRWLEPATMDVIESLGSRGTRQVLAIPVSFVSDHIETLYEIDILYRDLAKAAGILEFRRARALNGEPGLIAALAGIVKRELAPLGLGAPSESKVFRHA